MARATSRRPVPALVFLVALIALTAVVWVRVLARDSSASVSCPPPAPVVLPQPKSVTLQVLNGTQRNNLAHQVAASLQKDGFRIATIGDDEQPVSGVGEIRYGTDGLSNAKLVAYYLPGAKLVPADLDGSAVVVSLGSTFRAVSSPTAVAAAIRKAMVSQAPASAPVSSAALSPSASVPASCVAAASSSSAAQTSSAAASSAPGASAHPSSAPASGAATPTSPSGAPPS